MRDRAKDSSPVDRPSSFVSLLSGWAQQGVESVLATRRILVDVASRQSAAAVKTLREGLSDPKHSARTILTDLVVEGTANFIEAQRILLTLAQEENKIVMTDVEERIGGYPAAAAIANRLHHAVDAFVEMQQGLLTIASKQSQHWLQPKEKGKRQLVSDAKTLERCFTPEELGSFLHYLLAVHFALSQLIYSKTMLHVIGWLCLRRI